MAESKTSEPVIKEALERFMESQDGSEHNRQAAYEDIGFARMADQWPENIRKIREEEGRPCLTINKLPAFIRQVVNESRQNKPAVKVSPVDNGADEDTAEVIGGLVRSVWRNGSGGDVATDTAIDHAVSGGFGFFRITTDYCHAESFDLEARVERIPNPLMVHWDVSSTEFDASDWNYAFVSDLIPSEEFKARYPKAAAVNFEGDARDYADFWLDDDRVRVAEYWLREEDEREIVLLTDGSVMRADDLGKNAKAYLAAGGLDPASMSDDDAIRAVVQMTGVDEARRRKAAFHTVTRRIISGVEELEKEDWQGSMIPICPVWGEEVWHDGRRYFRSMVRDAKDPQTMFNFWRSVTTELVALAPRAPFLMEEGSIPKGQEAKWQTANSRSHAYLEYVKGATPPQRQTFAGVPAGALQEALNASDDMKAIIGIYDPSLGARSNETSGRAIIARQREADNSNFHFIDNLSRAIRYAGRVLVEIIPQIYGTRQAIRILGEDQKEKVVKLAGGAEPENGERLYDLSVGKYDVTVSVGPSYATQRQETAETLIEIMRQVPGSAPYIGDILADHLDFPGAEKLKKRLELLLPPQVQMAEGITPQMMPGLPGQPTPGAPMGQPGQPPAMPGLPNPPTPGQGREGGR